MSFGFESAAVTTQNVLEALNRLNEMREYKDGASLETVQNEVLKKRNYDKTWYGKRSADESYVEDILEKMKEVDEVEKTEKGFRAKEKITSLPYII